MSSWLDRLKAHFRGEVLTDDATLTKYSRDASLFEVQPTAVLYPHNTADLQNVVNFVREEKSAHPELSITGRSAGTDMSGGAINESLIVDFTKYFKKCVVDRDGLEAVVEPGVFYRELDAVTRKDHISLPVFPASRDLAALGGMIMNNAAGEKTLRYGQTRDMVKELAMVLVDGKEYTFKKLTRPELESKLSQTDFEGGIYNKVYELVTKNWEVIKKFAPTTSKNSSGYALWRVWDPVQKTFDLSQLFVGSQGTLGLLTQAKMKLVKDAPYRRLIAVFCKDWLDLPAVVNAVLPLGPESMETFDDTTIKLGMRFMPAIARKVHQNIFSFALHFLPEALIGLQMLGLPKLVVLIELAEESSEAVITKAAAVTEKLKKFPVHARVLRDGPDADKYWVMRRESFNLLRQRVKGKKAAPFIDDFIIDPAKMPEFLPKLLAILHKAGIAANIAGHAGNGNYHIIPLMDIAKASERAKIVPVSKQVYDLIIEYGGSITAEHNDGIMRTPFVEQMFGAEMYQLFKQIKTIFDPQNIFNPGKKVGGTLEYLEQHLAKK
jgi:FAD/FMN-containing dehydrogenase